MNYHPVVLFKCLELIKISNIGADVSGNCSVSTLKKRENCSLEYRNCSFADKIFDDIFSAEGGELNFRLSVKF